MTSPCQHTTNQRNLCNTISISRDKEMDWYIFAVPVQLPNRLMWLNKLVYMQLLYIVITFCSWSRDHIMYRRALVYECRRVVCCGMNDLLLRCWGQISSVMCGWASLYECRRVMCCGMNEYLIAVLLVADTASHFTILLIENNQIKIYENKTK